MYRNLVLHVVASLTSDAVAAYESSLRHLRSQVPFSFENPSVLEAMATTKINRRNQLRAPVGIAGAMHRACTQTPQQQQTNNTEPGVSSQKKYHISLCVCMCMMHSKLGVCCCLSAAKAGSPRSSDTFFGGPNPNPKT